jgi:glucose/arabinose dehydrogenase
MRSYVIAAAVALLAPIASGARERLVAAPYLEGLDLPLGLVQDPSDASIQYVPQLGGVIRIVEDGRLLEEPFADLSEIVGEGRERGLFSIAFPPGDRPGPLYAYFSDKLGDSVIVSIQRDSKDPRRIDLATLAPVLRVKQWSGCFHYGGAMHFGPLDGYLYISLGDGGGMNDPFNHAQNPWVLQGKILRIDPMRDDFPNDSWRNYSIPVDNPFLDGDPILALPEIWSFGHRNVWKWSFDDPSLLGRGGMFLADVGQDKFEEISYEPPLVGARNYGWRMFEGFSETGLDGQSYGPLTLPIFAYGRDFGASISGGYAYRGTNLGAEFFGRYFAGDFGSGRILSLAIGYLDNGEAAAFDPRDHTEELGVPSDVVSVDRDAAGELYVTSLFAGTIFRIESENGVWLRGARAVEGGLIGGLRELLAEDERFVTATPSVLRKDGGRLPTKLEFTYRTDVEGLANVDLVARGQVSDGEAEVWWTLWNPNAQTWDEVARFNLGTRPRTLRQSLIELAGYIDDEGRIRWRLESSAIETGGAELAVLHLDMVGIQRR